MICSKASSSAVSSIHTLDPRTDLIARMTVLTLSFLLAPGLLTIFLSSPATKTERSELVPAVTTSPALPIQPVATLEQTTTVQAGPLIEVEPEPVKVIQPPRSNEFTRHLSVVAINNVSNAELQITTDTVDAFAGRIDQLALLDNSVDSAPTPYFHGVGYPQISTFYESSSKHYKRFRTLISYADPETRSLPIPNVRCMGLSPRAVARRAAQFDKPIDDLADRYNIDANLVKAVVTRESCFDNAARSHVGAIGLMQLMPQTAMWLKVEDPTNADQNLRAGVKYLSSLKRRFGSNELALAAYNAGPGNVERHNGVPPFKETLYYIESVMSHYRSYSATEKFTQSVALY
jgi:hypothetical protein